MRPGDEVGSRRRLRVVRPLGRGGHGTVWLAADLDGGEPVAVKVLGASPDLRRELSALLAIDSDRVPQVLDWDVDADPPWLAVPYFPHGSLDAVLEVVGTLEEPHVWQLLVDLLTALSAAHRASLLHLDVKPANVLIDADGRYVLTDFGVSQGARIGGGVVATAGVGTPGFASPEQRRGSPDSWDLRTDLYGAGATAWAAWAGVRHPGAFAEQGLPPVTDVRDGASPELAAVIAALVRQDPDGRPGSADEALIRVEAALYGPGGAPEPLGAPVADPDAVIAALIDPLWVHVLRSNRARLVAIADGSLLCREGDRSHDAWLLVHGTVRAARDGVVTGEERREGAFLGVEAALAGAPRAVTLQAVGEVIVWPLGAAALERLITSTPAVGVRLVRALAGRLG